MPRDDGEQRAEERMKTFDVLSKLVTSGKRTEAKFPILLLGDSNGSAGDSRVSSITGPHGRGPVTPAGEQFLEFATLNGLRVMNSFFAKNDNHTFTWYHPRSQVGYTLDHCLVKTRDAAMVCDVEALKLAECESDHRLLMTGPVDEVAAELAAAVREAASRVLGPAQRRRFGKVALSGEFLAEIAAERRALLVKYNQDKVAYASALKEMRARHQKECRRRLRVWWNTRLQELSGPKGGPNKSAHDSLRRELLLRTKTISTLLDKDGAPLCGAEAQVARWREHFGAVLARESCADLAYVTARVPPVDQA
eukprot:gene7205-5797_t